LDFIRSFALRIIGIAILGIASAFAATHLGIEKSVFATASTGAAIGWGAHWLWSILSSQPSNGTAVGSRNRPRKAPLLEESDKTITLQTPASKKNFSKDGERA
jgi:hypothetical protein